MQQKIFVSLWMGTFLVLACGGPTGGGGEAIFAGAVPDTDVQIALVRNDTKLTLYVCGGPTTYQTHSRWYVGDTMGNAFDLNQDGWNVNGELEETATGTVVSPDASIKVAFEIARVGSESWAGLYESRESGCRTGAVALLQSGGYTVQGTWCNDAGETSQVVPVAPAVITQEGIRVELADGPAAGTSFFVQQVRPNDL